MKTKTYNTLKRFLLPIFATVLFLSCSKDDDQPQFVLPTVPSFVKAKINGTEYQFNNFSVNTENVVTPDYSYVDLHVIATIPGDDTRRIEFKCEQDVAGANSIYFFYAFYDGDFDYDFEETDIDFSANLTFNSNRRLIGTFSGTLDSYDNAENIQITDGSFDITY